jgi:hypothetical protein
MRLPNSNYDVPPKTINCATPNITTFSNVKLTCSTEDNTAKVVGNPASANGLIQISIDNIDNAVREGEIDDIIFMTYDGFN